MFLNTHIASFSDLLERAQAVTIFTGNGAREKGIVVPRKMPEAAARLDVWAPHFCLLLIDFINLNGFVAETLCKHEMVDSLQSQPLTFLCELGGSCAIFFSSRRSAAART